MFNLFKNIYKDVTYEEKNNDEIVVNVNTFYDAMSDKIFDGMIDGVKKNINKLNLARIKLLTMMKNSGNNFKRYISSEGNIISYGYNDTDRYDKTESDITSIDLITAKNLSQNINNIFDDIKSLYKQSDIKFKKFLAQLFLVYRDFDESYVDLLLNILDRNVITKLQGLNSISLIDDFGVLEAFLFAINHISEFARKNNINNETMNDIYRISELLGHVPHINETNYESFVFTEKNLPLSYIYDVMRNSSLEGLSATKNI
jgi:hypothetical protein